MSQQWGPIQIIPPGLLGYLQVKNVGQNPNTLDSNIQPTLELLHWLLRARQVSVDPNTYARGFLTANRGFLSWTVPLIAAQDEWWYIAHYNIASVVVGAGDSIVYKPAWRSGQGGVYEIGDGYETLAVGQRGLIGGDGLWLPPGGELGVWVKDCTSVGGIQLNSQLDYTPLPT